MPITNHKHRILKDGGIRIEMPGTHLAEATRDRTDKPKQKPPMFIPADQVAVVQVLAEILEELKGLREDLKRK